MPNVKYSYSYSYVILLFREGRRTFLKSFSFFSLYYLFGWVITAKETTTSIISTQKSPFWIKFQSAFIHARYSASRAFSFRLWVSLHRSRRRVDTLWIVFFFAFASVKWRGWDTPEASESVRWLACARHTDLGHFRQTVEDTLETTT